MQRSGLAIFSAGVACTALFVAAGMGGCQSSGTSGAGAGSQSTGAGAGSSTSSTSTSTSTSSTSTSSTSTSTSSGAGGSSTSSTSSSSGGPACDGMAATIQDITSGTIGPAIKVKVTGVVAMSQKFLVSKSKAGSCLWGVYVSAPTITETAAGTGILALSYGTDASIPDGGTKAFCPALGFEPAGDQIPDDTKPGDVLDLTGSSDYFVLPQCASTPGGTSVAQYQISKICAATKTGTAAVPTPHVLTPAEAAKLADGADKAFHDQWGGTKVRIENVTAIEAPAPDAGVPPPGGPVDGFGVITLDAASGGLTIPDTVYYQGYSKKNNLCHAGPVFASDAFTAIQGFNTINFCTWSLYPDNKCKDFEPASSDCSGLNCN